MSWGIEEDNKTVGPDDGVVIHHIVESLQVAAKAKTKGDKDFQAMTKAKKTTAQIAEFYLDKGDDLMAINVVMMETLSLLHGLIHDVVGGAGIKAISNEAVKNICVDYFNSDDFKKKYYKRGLIDEKELKQLLGI